MLHRVTRPDPTNPPANGTGIWLAIAAGGALGATMRFGLTRLLAQQSDWDPWLATAGSNVLGALALGFLLARLSENSHPLLRPFLATGLLGSFTTFSTLLLENDALFQTSPVQALMHLTLVIGLGLAAFPVGEALGGRRPSPGAPS